MENKVENQRTILLTGATNGIGRIVAEKLAAEGHTLLLVGRKEWKCEDLITELEQKTGNTKLHFYQADLSLLREIETLAETVARDYGQLDALINNAGAVYSSRVWTEEHLERTFALNYLGVFYLTELLLPLLRKSSDGRIVNVSSAAHALSRMNFQNLQGEQKYNGLKQYGLAKLSLLLYTYDLSQRLRHENIKVNALHPGNISTGFGLNNKNAFYRGLNKFTSMFGDSPEEGADLEVSLASGARGSQVTGKYFTKKGITSSSSDSYSTANQRKLREISEELVYHYTGRELQKEA
ncbi:SDR family NAD(P)-dependent oxidoreductase [Marinococcus luteus]|uniref:SDR family NAD(P)-dependent oxidoreductase n=1 Tax=Marinococcus luteus TaxID=1122204 RepID=UPI002ACC79B8|nr:SDR family NAD(P)-dependent oxidoreductase [Marinococcus luteus]MDZ5784385.1 SDR family NAD(P)-dependent oxidoreductase [Marinococcus luteus]